MESRAAVNIEVTLVGHPFALIGMGEHLRAVFRALRAAGLKVGVRDVYGVGSHDPDVREELTPYIVQELSPEINVFCLNGDEIEPALQQVCTQLPGNALNIVYPAWELSKYPRTWAEQLNKFDEVWAASAFTQHSISSSAEKPVLHMPLPGELKLKSFLERRYFGIPESSFVF